MKFIELKIAAALLFFNVVNSGIQFQHKWNDWATHQPVLYEMAIRTSGPIIEFGCGNSSTDMLHEICKRNKRLLVTVEDDFEWMSKFAKKYLGDGYEKDNAGWHKFFFVPGKTNVTYDTQAAHWVRFLDTFDLLNQVGFDVCFVDQSPWRARIETILCLKDKVKYIVLHDCDYYAVGILGTTIVPMDTINHIPGVYDFSKTFRYFKVYFPTKPWPGLSGPPTLLGSNFEFNLPAIDYANY